MCLTSKMVTGRVLSKAAGASVSRQRPTLTLRQRRTTDFARRLFAGDIQSPEGAVARCHCTAHYAGGPVTALPRVIDVEWLGDHRLRLEFSDHTAGSLDCRRWLRGPVFEPLKNPAYFRRVFIDGESIAWPNGADIAPEALYAAIRRRKPPTR